jgi:hypothetical protein
VCLLEMRRHVSEKKSKSIPMQLLTEMTRFVNAVKLDFKLPQCFQLLANWFEMLPCPCHCPRLGFLKSKPPFLHGGLMLQRLPALCINSWPTLRSLGILCLFSRADVRPFQWSWRAVAVLNPRVSEVAVATSRLDSVHYAVIYSCSPIARQGYCSQGQDVSMFP